METSKGLNSQDWAFVARKIERIYLRFRNPLRIPVDLEDNESRIQVSGTLNYLVIILFMTPSCAMEMEILSSVTGGNPGAREKAIRLREEIDDSIK